MAKKQPNLCRNCKFCLRLFDYEPESYSLFCDNDLTKEMEHPIGFLRHDGAGCEFFEGFKKESEGTPPRAGGELRVFSKMLNNKNHAKPAVRLSHGAEEETK